MGRQETWRAGSYQWKTTLSTFECTVIRFAHGEDFITVYSDDNEHVQIYDRETLKLKRNFRPNYPEYRIMDLNTVVYLESDGLAIHNINTGQLLRRFYCRRLFSSMTIQSRVSPLCMTFRSSLLKDQQFFNFR